MKGAHILELLSSDVALACLIPLVLLFTSLYVVGIPSLHELRAIVFGRRSGAPAGPFSLPRAVVSYEQYEKLAQGELAAMRSSYLRMSWAHRRIGYDLGYPAKLARLGEAIEHNAAVARAIAGLGRAGANVQDEGVVGDLGRAREALKHFVRDWSSEGRVERDRIFAPILDVLREVDPAQRASQKVLVPGAGLGRLAWEISELGYETTANELSCFMTLALRFLLSPETTQTPNQHSLRPYASWFSHQRTTDALFRTVAFPDAVPRLRRTFALDAGDFLALSPPGAGYDAVVTLFFIDTSLNAIATLQRIHALLRPGGTWINLGPLLWTGGGQAAVELSLEEVLRLADAVGFDVVGGEERGVRRRRTVECEYTADQVAMMRWLYQAEFWVATKRA